MHLGSVLLHFVDCAIVTSWLGSWRAAWFSREKQAGASSSLAHTTQEVLSSMSSKNWRSHDMMNDWRLWVILWGLIMMKERESDRRISFKLARYESQVNHTSESYKCIIQVNHTSGSYKWIIQVNYKAQLWIIWHSMNLQYEKIVVLRK